MNLLAQLATGSRMLLVFAALLTLGPGCSQKLEPIFEEHYPEMLWPPSAASAKVRYVGQLRSSADLKPPRKPFEALGELLVGRKEPDALYGPRSIIRTTDGDNLWVADPGGRCLHLFNLRDRRYRRVINVGDAVLLSPVGLCLGPAGSFYVCDSENAAIYRLSEVNGSHIESLRLPEEVQRPVAVWFDTASHRLLVVDATAHNIKVLDPSGRLLRIIGQRGGGPGEFNFPCDITGDGELIWVVDTGNHRVQCLTLDGEPVISFGQAGDAPGDFAMPKGIALNSQGHIFVVDARFENVQIFDRTGRLLLFLGQEGIGPGEFWLPSGLVIDSTDRIWICDSYNRRVQVFDYLAKTRAQATTQSSS